jgi:hypothetical protein
LIIESLEDLKLLLLLLLFSREEITLIQDNRSASSSILIDFINASTSHAIDPSSNLTRRDLVYLICLES